MGRKHIDVKYNIRKNTECGRLDIFLFLTLRRFSTLKFLVSCFIFVDWLSVFGWLVTGSLEVYVCPYRLSQVRELLCSFCICKLSTATIIDKWWDFTLEACHDLKPRYPMLIRCKWRKRNITPNTNQSPNILSEVTIKKSMRRFFHITIARKTRDWLNIHVSRREIQSMR